MPKFEEFRLPDVGEGLTEAEIVRWVVEVGASVNVNDVLVEIETAKSLVELPSPWHGVVADLLVDEGTTVDVGAPIITIDTDPFGPPAAATGGPAVEDATEGSAAVREQEDAAAQRAATVPGEAGAERPLVGYGVAESGPTVRRRRHGESVPAAGGSVSATSPAPAQPPVPVQPSVSVQPSAPTPSSTPTKPPVLAKPPVRKLAKDLGIALSAVTPTGPGGIVTREDVLAQVAEAAPRALATYAADDQPWLESGSVSADGRQTRVPVRSVRKRTAEAMVTSAFTAPHVTVFQTLDVTRTMKLVARLKEDREFGDVRVSPLLIVAKALLLAVRRHPEVNASWDDAAQEIVYKHYVNLGIAAATPRGLVVPNIKDAHRLGLHDLALAIAELTTTARAGRTTPAAMTDGTITITNVGVFGIDTGTPILNPGEAAILAFGAIRKQPWVHKGKVRPRYVTQLALSFDHRFVDGELGSRLLADVAAVLADPAQALVWG